MYYVNQEQIGNRLTFLPQVGQAAKELASGWKNDILHAFAQERVLYLGIEAVTDVGSFLIDGFMMRDASSYEDIVEILIGEQVFDPATGAKLLELVRLRRAIAQDYTSWDRSAMHPLLPELPEVFEVFARSVEAFVRKELGAIGL
ncbi:hypothetical protein J31TS4_13830 [Paenibacillus sp. J31TS4]|uniref:DUF86 domain-containing protein n=1 Tax=Paenibacillus sp. J31TS4 TaxID=2807195 RepID=UPI001B2EDCC6|nr:HepT-like ribonuclease domain-containing protein [Paenibacillus sp. J31TS4]GIP38103.1 hypothetical protein J31TS4_13830 [Paenibacillus sp. J31TS4]